MPWTVKGKCVYDKAGKVVKCHPSAGAAEAHRRALYANYKGGKMAEALLLEQAPKAGTNWKQVTPSERAQLSGLMKHYAKKPHPFTSCVRDNTKRFGPERAKRVCAVLKDLIRGTTKWRGKEEEVLDALLIEIEEARERIAEVEEVLGPGTAVELADAFLGGGEIPVPALRPVAEVMAADRALLECWLAEEKWIKSAIKRPGQLHRDLGVKQGEKISDAKLRAAAKRKDKVGARARLALRMKSMGKSKEEIEAAFWLEAAEVPKAQSDEEKERERRRRKKGSKREAVLGRGDAGMKGDVDLPDAGVGY
jgi:hypothetical protein